MAFREYCSATKKNENLSFATTLKELQGITLCEVNQIEKKNSVYFHLHAESKTSEWI